MLRARNAVEDRIVGVVLLRDEDDVFDLLRHLARHGGDNGRGHRVAVGATVHHAVVSQHVRGHRLEFAVGRHIENADNAAHAEEIALGDFLARVRPIPEAAEADANQLPPVRRKRDAVRVPRSRDVPEHRQRSGVQHGDGVDAQLGDVKSLAVGRHRHARRTDAAHPGHQRRGHDALFLHNLVLRQVNSLDHVVVAVRHEKCVAMRRQEVGRAATHGLAVVRGRADQQARLQTADDLWRLGIRNVHAPDGKRFGHVRLAQARNLAPLELHSVARFLAGIAVRREREAALVEAVVLGRPNGTVFEQADVRGINPFSHHGQRVGIASHPHRANHLPPFRVHHHDAEVGHVRAIKIFAVGAHFHVHGVAILVVASADFRVQRHLGDLLPGRHVEEINGARFAAAPIERAPIRREIGAPGVCRLLLFAGFSLIGRRGDDRHFRLRSPPVGDDLPHAVAGDEQRVAVAAHGQAVGKAGHGQVPADRLQVAAGRKNGQAVRIVPRIGFDGGCMKIRRGRRVARRGKAQENEDGRVKMEAHGCLRIGIFSCSRIHSERF